MGCKDAVLTESLLKNQTVNCLTFEKNTRKPFKDNLCLFRALAFHSHGNERLEEKTSKLFNLFFINSTNPDPSNFQGVCMEDIPSVEDIVGINIFMCHTFFRETGNLERHLVRCSERVKHIYPKNVYQLRETLFDKLDPFDIQYTDDQTLFTKLAVFDFESICILKEKFKTPRRQLGLVNMFQYQSRHLQI